MDQGVKAKLSTFFENGKTLNYKKGEMIIRSEDVPQGVYYVEDGYIRTYALLEDGREIVLNISQRGAYFPMAWAISNRPNHYYFEALSDVVLKRVSKEEMLSFLSANPDILFELINYITDCQDRVLEHIEKVLSGSSRQRIAALLSIFAQHYGVKKNSGMLIKIPLTHQDIANLTCMTRETVSLQMSSLKKQKTLTYSQNKIVVNLPKLEKN